MLFVYLPKWFDIKCSNYYRLRLRNSKRLIVVATKFIHILESTQTNDVAAHCKFALYQCTLVLYDKFGEKFHR